MRDQPKSDEDWILQYFDFLQYGGPGLRILELGCGRGRDTVHLVTAGEVVAIDIDQRVLSECTRNAASASHFCVDIARGLPFRNASFDFVLASLSIHYFNWDISRFIASEMKRCLVPNGRAIVRVNSTNDTNYGADSNEEIEPHFFQVGHQTKRFFDRKSLEILFQDWTIVELVEKEVDRYAKRKWIWETLLIATETN